jgi:hypothetical protein
LVIFDIGDFYIFTSIKTLYTIACDENNPCASKYGKVRIQLY